MILWIPAFQPLEQNPQFPPKNPTDFPASTKEPCINSCIYIYLSSKGCVTTGGGMKINALINYAGSCANLISVLQREETKSFYCMSSSRGFVILSTLRLISHKHTFQRRTQIMWKSLYKVNEWLTSLLSWTRQPKEKCSRKVEMRDSALRRQSQG